MIIDRYRRWVALDGAVLLIAGVLLLGAGAADAGTIHHWRFEDGAYLDDSIGGATLTARGAAQ